MSAVSAVPHSPDRRRPARVIPVLDLAGGVVVHAMRGQREHYRPVDTERCPAALGLTPAQIAQRLVQAAGAGEVYVADLDALQGGALQHRALAELMRSAPGLRWWIDAGFADVQAARQAGERWLREARPAGLTAVLASESMSAREPWPAAQELPEGLQFALSLDRRDGQRLDRAGWWSAPQDWPQTLIVMTLERVGADSGPDLQTVQTVREQAGRARRVVGAGGIRGRSELGDAGLAGADDWLVASALHRADWG